MHEGNLADYFSSSILGQTKWHYDFHKVGTKSIICEAKLLARLLCPLGTSVPRRVCLVFLSSVWMREHCYNQLLPSPTSYLTHILTTYLLGPITSYSHACNIIPHHFFWPRNRQVFFAYDIEPAIVFLLESWQKYIKLVALIFQRSGTGFCVEKEKKMNFHFLSGYLQFSFKSVGDASVDSCVLVRRPNPGLPLRLPLVGRPGRGYDRHFHRAGELIYDIDSV